ncbi:MAG: hypothetical protein JSR58_03645 [Verrucomicrobia bacterium]|nr:hypothetical protein [Verrucomicrobiota bacterium]
MKRRQKEQEMSMKAMPKAKKQPRQEKNQPQQPKKSGWRTFIDRYCSL